MTEPAAEPTAEPTAEPVDGAAAVAAAVAEPTPADAPFYFSEGVAGEGEVPEWFKGDKYGTVAEQAKAYTDLEGRFGAFTGAPDEYALTLSEELVEKGVVIDEDDTILEAAREFAKASNMNQDGFNNMVELYAMTKLAEEQALNDFKQEEIKSLGDKGSVRLDNLDKWAKATLPPDMYDGLISSITTAESVKAIEHLVGLTRNAPIKAPGVASATGSAEEVRAMQFEKDEYGNRRIQTDPEFKKRYEALRDQVHGTHDHIEVMG